MMKSRTGHYKLIADGACLGNPGESSAGFVISDSDSNEVFRGSVVLGKGTNNTAEYSAIIEGLKAALRIGVNKITVYSDSELVIKQLTGEYSVKSGVLEQLKDRVLRESSKFKSAEFIHLGREKTSAAHNMAEGILKIK